MHLLSILPLATLSTAYLFTVSLPPFSHPHSYNPSALPASTHATLYKYKTTLTAPLTRRNTLEFRDIPTGSYLLTIHCRDWTFSPGRVDVNGSVAAVGVQGESEGKVKVDAWQTFWGGEWGNRGEWWGGGVVGGTTNGKQEEEVVKVAVRPKGKKEYYTEKQGFSPLSFLKSPMILMGGFSLLLIVGLPYIIDNMDEETKAEFEEAQKSSPGGGNPAAALQNFDLASWMAGKGGGGGTIEVKK